MLGPLSARRHFERFTILFHFISNSASTARFGFNHFFSLMGNKYMLQIFNFMSVNLKQKETSCTWRVIIIFAVITSIQHWDRYKVTRAGHVPNIFLSYANKKASCIQSKVRGFLFSMNKNLRKMRILVDRHFVSVHT